MSTERPAEPPPAARPDMARLVADHADELYRYAYRLAGQSADAEDLTQQTFLVAQTKLDQLRSPDACRSWLFAILRNCFLKSARGANTIALAGDLPLESVAAAEAPDDWDDDRELLQQALNELPAEFRLVLAMFYFEECSYREIAERLELPIGTVMSRLSRAKNHLRSRLGRPTLATAGRGGRT